MSWWCTKCVLTVPSRLVRSLSLSVSFGTRVKSKLLRELHFSPAREKEREEEDNKWRTRMCWGWRSVEQICWVQWREYSRSLHSHTVCHCMYDHSLRRIRSSCFPGRRWSPSHLSIHPSTVQSLVFRRCDRGSAGVTVSVVQQLFRGLGGVETRAPRDAGQKILSHSGTGLDLSRDGTGAVHSLQSRGYSNW